MLTSASPAKKQEFAEALIVQSLFLLLANGNAGSDPQRRAALAQGARKGALAMGLDLDAFRLTPTGFVAAE